MVALESMTKPVGSTMAAQFRAGISGYMNELRGNGETPYSSLATRDVLDAATLDGAPAKGLIFAAHEYLLHAHEQSQREVAGAAAVIYRYTGHQVSERVRGAVATVITPWTAVGGAVRGVAVDRFGLNKGRAMTPCTWWPGSGDVSQPGGFW